MSISKNSYYFINFRNKYDKPNQSTRLTKIVMIQPEALCSNGNGMFMPKKPETIVGIVNRTDKTVSTRIVSFKLLFSTLL